MPFWPVENSQNHDPHRHKSYKSKDHEDRMERRGKVTVTLLRELHGASSIRIVGIRDSLAAHCLSQIQCERSVNTVSFNTGFQRVRSKICIWSSRKGKWCFCVRRINLSTAPDLTILAAHICCHYVVCDPATGHHFHHKFLRIRRLVVSLSNPWAQCDFRSCRVGINHKNHTVLHIGTSHTDRLQFD